MYVGVKSGLNPELRRNYLARVSERIVEFQCSGEMRRYLEEHQWRRRLSGRELTLNHESVGSEGIRYPCSPRRKRCTLSFGGFDPFGAQANALSVPPEDYGRKAKLKGIDGPHSGGHVA